MVGRVAPTTDAADEKLYLADANGKVIAEDQMAATAAIRCSKEERAAKLPANYNSLVEKMRTQFEKAFAEHLAAGGFNNSCQVLTSQPS